MEMTAADVFRYFIFVGFGAGCTLMVATNFVAFQTLKVPGRVGFLWWHVTSVSTAFLALGTVALDSVINRLGLEFRWQTLLTVVGVSLFFSSQLIIYKVERERLRHHRALLSGAAERGYGGLLGEGK